MQVSTRESTKLGLCYSCVLLYLRQTVLIEGYCFNSVPYSAVSKLFNEWYLQAHFHYVPIFITEPPQCPVTAWLERETVTIAVATLIRKECR